MVCTHKSSGSNWLDRLRLSKGFSLPEHNNIDQFLAQHTPGGPDSLSNNSNAGSESSSDPVPVRTVNEPGLRNDQAPAAPNNTGDKEEMCNVVTNVLSDLFCMGESVKFSKVNGKKASRKQKNPKYFASSGINSNAEGGKRKEEAASVEKCPVGVKDSSQVKVLEQSDDLNLVEEEEDKSQDNLMGFSRTEVTVIDTSFAPWKFEKLLFRKKNVWKVRDRKGKSMNFGKKKRKATNDDDGGKKKQKVIIRGEDGHAANGGVCKYSVNEKLQLNDKLEESSKRTSDSVGQASKKKHGYLKLKKASSSVVLIKNIPPPSKKNGTGIAKNFLKPSDRQCQLNNQPNTVV
ncbi:hypothetical protein CQW23_08026 [Capsicum baccatum]|uniref:Uncharacterized protein n=1 Tax=Capsicum baccatum TaxID=33114 RepID=A0A2G2X7S4_CAPBA|nr:hypothetical protein CQW23_08026 [Capsicum baccatum]